MSSSSGTLSPRASPEPLKSSKKRKTLDVPEIEVDINLPEPPSKKAKRALKKGKVLPPKPTSDDDEPASASASGTKTTTTAKKERSPYGVWIGNLRFTVTRDDLRAWLVENSGGAIAPDAITRVHLPASKTAPKHAAFENRGFAYVDFATYEANVAAIALSETEWHRRKLLIKDAKSYEGRPAVKKEDEENKNTKDGEAEPEQPVSTSRKIFVGNLGFQTTEEDVKELFSKCGEIEWVKVATFEDSGKCKGYGWVKFAEAIAADWAVKGFVKIKEVEETEEDFIEEEDKAKAEEGSSSSSDEDSDASSDSGCGSDSDSDSDSDSSSGSDSSSSEEEDEEEEKPKPTPAKKTRKPPPAPEKKVKMRKWWVNTLHGRRLKIEHAEDDQTRYKKRFKKNPVAQRSNGGDADGGRAPRANTNFNNKPRDGGARAGGQRKDPGDWSKNNVDITVARLTGAPVKSEGKKTTFD